MSLISRCSPHNCLQSPVELDHSYVPIYVSTKMRSNLLQSRPTMERKSSTPSSSSIISDARVPQLITSQSLSVGRNSFFDLPSTIAEILPSFGRARYPNDKFEYHSA